MADIIDINVLETVEEVTINVVDNVIQVNINKVTSTAVTNTSELINDGEDGVHPYITLLDLPSNLILYPTTVASDVSGYVKLVTDIHDPEYNVTAVNVSTGSITTTSQLISSLITVPNLINGNPGVFNISTIGNIRRTTGSGTAEFYFNIYKRDALGVETLIGVSNPTLPSSSGVYAEFSSTAIWDDGIFTDTDRVVLKFYANRISGGSNPTYEFQFGGLTPVRTLVPIPLSVVPNNGLQSVTGTTVDNTDPLNPIVNVPTLQQVLDIGTSLVGNNNFQGSSAGSGNSGTNNNGFGFAPLVNNTGNHVNAFGYYAGNINTFSGVNLFGKFAYADADNQLVMARYDDVIRARLSYINLTEDRKFELPDASGTLALTSDIPSPITIDATPTDGSTNAVSSNGVFDALALKVDKTSWINYSATSTIVGWSSTTIKDIRYLIQGNIMHVRGLISGTSNSTTTSFTLPQNYTDVSSYGNLNVPLTDNGTTQNEPGLTRILAGTNNMLFFKNGNLLNFTGSGTKQINFSFAFKIN